ncbi:TPA: VOC family protein, partial [Enterococcus faecium]|nr:VOC family protein [Enterococcus faecium]HCD2973275.1 VOC family protein [Enterococcus faecium]HCD4412372.1 VOC family protein [Enterococcus faecium]
MKLNGLQHIGIPTKDFGASKIFYESLGFSLINEEMNVGSKVGFFELNGTIIEIWEDKTTECRGAIDHLALDTDDIDEVFNSIQDLGYELLDKNIMELPFWENGIRYFNFY